MESSTDSQVELLVQVVEDPTGEELRGVNFQTSRAVLAQAAHDARILESVGDESEGVVTPPREWT